MCGGVYWVVVVFVGGRGGGGSVFEARRRGSKVAVSVWRFVASDWRFLGGRPLARSTQHMAVPFTVRARVCRQHS